MKKFIVLLSLTVFLVSCGATDSTQPEKIIQELSTSSNQITTWSKSTKAECMQWCRVMWKTNQWNKDRSDADMENDCNNLCEAGQWMQNNDPASCEKSQWILRDTCYSEIAQETKNPILCEKINDKMFISSCYVSLAEKMKDKTLCNKITDGMMKNICLESSSK